MLLVGGLPASADTTPQTLPFGQNWTNTGLITVNDNWSGVPGVVGFLGQDITTVTGTDPQTLLTDSTVANDLDVIANQTSTAITNGGVAEFQLTDPVVALQGSGTADAPHLLFTLDTTGLSNVQVAYNLRDIDGTADNSLQPVALQYRVGASGSYTNVPAGFVADASTGPSLATLVTPVSVVLPAAVNNQSLVQVRVITTNAVGNDEWIGVDDIAITTADAAPQVQATTPSDGALNVPVSSNLSVTFSEPVNVTGSWFTISCGTSGAHTATASGGPTSFTLDPDSDFAPAESCTVTVVGANVSDQDTADPPNTMAGNYVFSFSTVEPNPVLVSEVYGGGGNAGATLKNDFIELYNRSTHSVSLAGWSVQYGSATGSTWQVTPLSGSIPAGRNYLIQEGAGAGGTVDLPTPDATGGILMSATAGKVALVSSATALTGACPTGGAIVDLAGFGTTANCSETAPTAAPSNTTSVQRKGGGATDTDNNSADFTVGAPDPHPSADQAPRVASTIPADAAAGVALDANVTITFNEPVNTTGSWFTITCATSGGHGAAQSGGPTTFTLDPGANFATNESCTVTVVAANVTDQDAEDPPDTMAANYVFTFQTADIFTCGDPATFIHTIQGSGLASPLAGSAATIEGVVVGDYQLTPSEFGGFYVQEEDAQNDSNTLTSEGIFVFDNGFGANVAVGDIVRVRGTVTESNGLTQLGSVNNVAVCSTGNTTTPTSVSLPVASITDLESFEGMLVRFTQTLTATEVFNLGRFGEVSLSGVGRLYSPSAVAAPGAAAQAKRDENNRSRIILDDGNNQQNIDPTRYPQGGLSASNTLRVGDSLPGLTGVMDFRFANYRIQPIGPLTWDHTNPRTLAPEPVGGNLKVASFNVLNFFNGDGLGGGFPTARGANTPFELQRQKAKEVSALTAMNADIVGLMEMENDTGPNSALAELVQALNDATAPGTYAYVNTGVIGTDAIKVAVIYKPARVSPVGDWKIITSAVDPRFIDTRNRPSLAQTFQYNTSGAKLTVVVNHLKSKGSSCGGAPDDIDDPSGGNCNGTRTQAAEALVDWLATDPTGSGSPDYLMIGDMNSYTMESPISVFTDNGLANLVGQFGGLTAYSYVFNGESGYLDHALASASLASKATGVGHWHINPDEPTVLDYNVEFKTPNQVNTFYDPGPYRSSDHEPVVIGFQFNTAPTVDAGGPYAVAEGGSVALSATGDDVDGGTLTYAWDLDDNGTYETSGQTPTFSAAGLDGPSTHTVGVQVTDNGGQTATDTATVTVTNVAPDLSAALNQGAAEGSATSFALGSFSDPAGTLDAPYGVSVNWGDGSAASTSSAAGTGSLGSLTHTYADNGSYTVAVTVNDGDGGSDTASFTAAVTNVAPTATFNAPSGSFAGIPFTISLTSPSDPSSVDTAAGFTYAFDCGDGSGYGAFGPATSRSCVASDTGMRTVRGTIRDKDGGATEYTANVQVGVTYDSLCALVRAWSTDPKLADKLCDILAKAEKAAEKGKPKKEQHNLREFEKQLDKKKADRAFTDEQIATLLRLVDRL